MKKPAYFTVIILILLIGPACPSKPPHPPTTTTTTTTTVPPDPITIKINVCSETNLLPNPYCPAIVEREFEEGTEPTSACSIHKKPKTKVRYPWKPGAPLLAWSGTLYSSLAHTGLDEKKLDELYEAMAVDGINAERNFAWYSDIGTVWAGTSALPWNADWTWNETYWTQLDRRLAMWCGDRNGTEIISIIDACSFYEGESWEVNPLNKLATRPPDVFWSGPARDKVINFARELVNRTSKYSPRIIFETRNEGGQVVGFDALRDYDQTLIAALKLEGVPASRIQVNWYDSGLFYQTISEDLEGEGLAATHQVCSEKSVDWYKTSPGKQALMKLGDYPCSDGPDFEDEADGLAWFWLPDGQGRRPSAIQIGYIVRTMSELGHPRFEQLSASAFQRGFVPNLDDAIELGRRERLMLK